MMQLHLMICFYIMRTTITLDPSLLADLKRRAADSGTTVSRLIEDSVRLTIADRPAEDEEHQAFELVTYGKGGRFTDLDMDKTSTLIELDDIERYGRRGS